MKRHGFALLCLLLPGTGFCVVAGPIRLELNARRIRHQGLHARLVIPVSPGPTVLLYPEWIPGEHGPTGPVVDAAGLQLRAGGKPLAWRRDPLDMYAIRCQVPAGADAIEAELDFLLPPTARPPSRRRKRGRPACRASWPRPAPSSAAGAWPTVRSPTRLHRAVQAADEATDLTAALGMAVTEEGKIVDRVYEGGVRTPLLVSWRGQLAAGARIDHPVQVVDWMPTCTRLAGAEPQVDPRWDGQDIWDVVTGAQVAPAPRRLFWNFRGARHLGARAGDWKLIQRRPDDGPVESELYDIGNDPCETTDVAADQPPVVAQLSEFIAQQRQLDDTSKRADVDGPRVS